MSRNRAIEAVLARERQGALWDRRLLGFPVWPLERPRHYRMEYLRDHPGAALTSAQPQGLGRVRIEWDRWRASG